jgi:peptide-methionine (R)-S-oxide reductase
MKGFILILIAFFSVNCTTIAQEKKAPIKKETKTNTMAKTEKEWKEILTPEEYYILREKGTDRPGNGGYTKHFEKGTYVCAACNTQLFISGSKYESHCGWPSFDDAIDGTVEFTKDATLGMVRTEITCKACDGHLGHIFDDGPKETTGKRYCVNTTSIKFVKADNEK